MITQELEDNINFTHADARRRRLETVTVEHLVLVLIDNSSVRQCLNACRADTDSLRQDLEHFLESQVVRVAAAVKPRPTNEFNRVLRRAVHQTRSSRSKASGAHVLASVFAEPGSCVAYYLRKHGVERLAVMAYANRQTAAPAEVPAKVEADNELVAMAASGRLEMPFGRDAEVTEITRILGRKYKNNPLLVGEPGVGKTALVHKLAHFALSEARPPTLAGLSLFMVSIGDMVAGTKYRGDFEQRLRQLLEKYRACDNAVLFIDEIHTLIGAGAVSGSSLDAANIIKPLLDGAGLRCIGATTFAEYRRVFEKDAALSRRFQKIHVKEPPDAELKVILSGVTKRLAAHHQIEYTATAAAAAVRYSRRFLSARFFPDKAIDVLDDAGSRKRLHGNPTPVNDDDIAAAAVAAAGLPPRAAEQGRQLASLARQLSARVIDQPEAAQRLAAAVLRAQLGYEEGGRLAGAFLFAGPTGVGKTEMARQLADILGAPLLRYDMAECMEAHSVSRLIGAPPGYVGFENSGKLVEDIMCHPHAVVLLDEIDKAHPEVLNIFLQVMDYGALTDNVGRRADFSNVLLIMTSNAGAAQWERPPVGFNRQDAKQAGAEVLTRELTPEFRNRLDAIVRFMPLQRATLSRILTARLQRLSRFLASEKSITVQFGRRLRAGLLADGFSPTMGARPLERLLRERIMNVLAQADADGTLAARGMYKLEESAEDGTICLHTTEGISGVSSKTKKRQSAAAAV